MNAGVILAVGYAAILAGYKYMRRPVENLMGIDTSRKTPAHVQFDGFDYVPTKTGVLYGHHWMSVAGASPIIAAIVGLQWGWVPAILWMVLGVIFLGGIHDSLAMHISVRNKGGTYGMVLTELMGKAMGILGIVAMALAGALVVSIFLPLTASTLHAAPTASMATWGYMPLAFLFGWLLYRRRWSLLSATGLTLTLVAATVVIGVYVPIALPTTTWFWLMVGYAALTMATPIWVMLQPRDYLNAFKVGFVIVLGAIGLLIGRPAMTLPAFITWETAHGWLWPMLFVTISCGAATGLHAFISGGITSRQLDNEKDTHTIGYGGMVGETVIALMCALSVASVFTVGNIGDAIRAPGVAFPQALARNLAFLGLSPELAFTLASFTFAGVVITTMDTYGRSARYAIQDLGRNTILANPYVASAFLLGFVLLLYFTTPFAQLWTALVAVGFLVLGITILATFYWKAREGLATRGLLSGWLKVAFWLIVVTSGGAGSVLLRRAIERDQWMAAGLFALPLGMLLLTIMAGLKFFRKGGITVPVKTSGVAGGSGGASGD
ncbi:MAG TPA: carbon starvation CstA family protein [Bacillota bacterium]|nr:carbon starvation CstA family protein [Bacillota bacterium]